MRRRCEPSLVGIARVRTAAIGGHLPARQLRRLHYRLQLRSLEGRTTNQGLGVRCRVPLVTQVPPVTPLPLVDGQRRRRSPFLTVQHRGPAPAAELPTVRASFSRTFSVLEVRPLLAQPLGTERHADNATDTPEPLHVAKQLSPGFCPTRWQTEHQAACRVSNAHSQRYIRHAARA